MGGVKSKIFIKIIDVGSTIILNPMIFNNLLTQGANENHEHYLQGNPPV